MVKSTVSSKLWRSAFLIAALSNAGGLTAARLSGDLLNLALFVILSRRFGPAGIGQYAYAFGIAGFAYVGVNLGFEEYGIREAARLPVRDRPKLLGKLLTIQLGSLLLVLVGLVVFIVLTKPSAETKVVIWLLASFQMATAFSRTLFIPAYAQQAMTGAAFTDVVCRSTAVSLAILLVFLANSSLVAALFSYPIAGLVLLILAVRSAKRYVGKIDFSSGVMDKVRILHSAWPFAGSVFVFQLYARTSIIILSLVYGEAAAGIYATGLKFLEAGVMPLVFLGVAVYPELSWAFHHDQTAFSASTEKLLRCALLVGGGVAWALYFLVPLVVVPLFGGRFVEALAVVKPMALLGLLVASEMSFVRFLLAADRQVERLRLQSWAAMLNLLLNVILIPVFGIIGAVATSIIVSVFVQLLYYRVIRGDLDISRLAAVLNSFGVQIAAAFLLGLGSRWLTGNDHLAAVISLATYTVAVIGTGSLAALSSSHPARTNDPNTASRGHASSSQVK